MTKKKYDSENGVWRTIGGRRVFIRTGQSLSSAMKESGKFNSIKKGTEGTMIINNDEKKNLQDKSDFVAYGVEKWMAAKQDYRHSANMQEKYRKLVKNNPDNKELKDYYEKLKNETKESKANFDKEVEDYKNSTYGKINILRKEDYNKDIYSKNVADNVKFKDMKEDTIKREGVYDDLIEKNRQRDKENWEKGISYSDYSLDKAIEKKTNGKYKSYDEMESRKEYELYKRAKENPDSIDPMTENSTDWEALDKKYNEKYKTDKIREQISQPVEYDYKSVSVKELERLKRQEEKYGIGDNVKYEDGVTGKVVSKPTNGRMTVEWEDGTKNTYSENHPGIKKDTRVSRNSDKYTSEEYTGDISDLKARHTGQYIQNYKDEANEKIRNVLTGKSRADKSLEKYGLRVERDNSAQKEFGKRYFGKNVDIVDEKTGRMIHSSYDNYYDWDNSINAKPSVNSHDGKEWHTIKSGRYSKERKNVTNEFNYYDYLKKPNNDYKENSLGEKVAQFRKDKEYLKQHENEIKRANEVANRYMKTKYELDEYKERKSAKPDYDHFAGWELYSDDPNRYGDIVRNHNERNALKDRYQGTYNYLQSTTNMSGAEILELLKKIDEDRK